MIQATLNLVPKSAPKTQADRVRAVLGRGGWWTLEEIAGICAWDYWKLDTPCAISARLRSELRGKIEKRRRGGKGNLWEYRLR